MRPTSPPPSVSCRRAPRRGPRNEPPPLHRRLRGIVGRRLREPAAPAAARPGGGCSGPQAGHRRRNQGPAARQHLRVLADRQAGPVPEPVGDPARVRARTLEPRAGQDSAGKVVAGPAQALADGDRHRHADGDGGGSRSPRLARPPGRLHRPERRQGHGDPPRRDRGDRDDYRPLDRARVPAERQAGGSRHPRGRKGLEGAPRRRAPRRRQGGALMRGATRKEKWMATQVFLTAVLLAGASLARTVAPVKVTSVEEKGGKLFIHATAKPEFTVFKLSGPPRVVIDLNGGDVTAAVQSGGHPQMVWPAPGDRRIAGWSAAQFDEGDTRVGRIVVTLLADQKYDVSSDGTDLVLTVGEPNAVPAAAPAPAPAADPNLVLSREDVQEVRHPARTLGQVTVVEKDGSALVHLKADGEIGWIGIIELKNPGRLALDLHGVAGRFGKAGGALLVKGVRIGKTDDGARVVIDAGTDVLPKYRFERAADGLRVLVGEPKAVAAGPATGAKPEAKREPEVKPAQADVAKIPSAPKLVPIRAVDLRTLENRTEVLVALDEAVRFEVSRPDASTSVLTLHGVTLPDRLERNLDASSLGGPVTMLSSYRVPGGEDVKVVATVAKGTLDELTAQKGTLIWKFGGPRAVAQATTPAPRAAAMASDARAGPGQTTNVYDTTNYSGRKVDFNVKDIDIKNLLGAIAEISKKNIIVADDVKGTVTIKLRNVP